MLNANVAGMTYPNALNVYAQGVGGANIGQQAASAPAPPQAASAPVPLSAADEAMGGVNARVANLSMMLTHLDQRLQPLLRASGPKTVAKGQESSGAAPIVAALHAIDAQIIEAQDRIQDWLERLAC